MVRFQIIRFLEWNKTDTWNRWNMGWRWRGREGKQLRAQRIQGDAHSQSNLHKMATFQRKVQVQSFLCIAKFESVSQVRREYRRVINEEPPH
jgi:hypothetical protein